MFELYFEILEIIGKLPGVAQWLALLPASRQPVDCKTDFVVSLPPVAYDILMYQSLNFIMPHTKLEKDLLV